MNQPYQVLARKYRPKNFHELIGQSHVSKALINAIDNNRLHHAYLFTGTRGVGKTTIGRILSKCLNCEKGVTSEPCGQCNSCQMIEQGRFIDLIEIDAASRTKVEDTRELLDNVPYAPTQGRFKVYLIDEVHMLSTHSFNALLKTLEEPPSHVKFLLATTDPQKLPITIISRCLQFVLRPLPQEQLSQHLKKILTQENIVYADSALWQLAHAGRGSVRDSLSLTDQAIAFGQGKLSEDTVMDMLGLIKDADLASLLSDIYQNNRVAVAAQIENMRMQMVDANSIFDEIADLIHKIAMVQVLPSVSLNVNINQTKKIHEIAQKISADVLQLYYEIVITSRERMKLATTPMQALEMCLLRMLAFRPLAHNEILIDQNMNKQSIVHQEPVHQEPVHQEPVHQEPVHQEPVHQEPVHQEPVHQEPVHQEPVHQEPVHQEPVHQEQSNYDSSFIDRDADPRDLLKLAAQEVIGEWTNEKWDYWVQTARIRKHLDEDELAFARQGLMTGICDGESIFTTNLESHSFDATFNSFCEKLSVDFPNISCQIECVPVLTHSMQQTPENRQKLRYQEAIEAAHRKLFNSKVVQKISKVSHFNVKFVKLL